MVLGNFLKLLSFQEPPRHTERTQGGAEQHYRGATIRNTRNAWAEERPPAKVAESVRKRTWNRDIPT